MLTSIFETHQTYCSPEVLNYLEGTLQLGIHWAHLCHEAQQTWYGYVSPRFTFTRSASVSKQLVPITDTFMSYLTVRFSKARLNFKWNIWETNTMHLTTYSFQTSSKFKRLKPFNYFTHILKKFPLYLPEEEFFF